MPRFVAISAGYLSDVCMHVAAGQVVEFPAGREPKIDLNDPYNWLVPEDQYKPKSVLPQVGALPVVSEQKPKAHEVDLVRPAYDDNIALIQQAEAIQDGIVPPIVQPAAPVVAEVPAPVLTDALPPIPAQVPVAQEPVIDTTPVAGAVATQPEGSGNQDVL